MRRLEEAAEDPGAARRFWFEHATGAGKTVAAVGFIDASRTGGVLILTHRRNLVDQFIGEISDRGYKERLRPPLLGDRDDAEGPVTVETYQWFVRNHKQVSDAYSIVICDEAHTALGEKTSACIRAWTGPVFIGMTATGALIARHVADLFPTQTSRFDLAQAARRGVISPLRCMRIPPGPGVRTIAKVPLRKGEVDQDFDQEELAALLDQSPSTSRSPTSTRRASAKPPASSTRPGSSTRRTSPKRSRTRGSSPVPSPARRRSANWPRSSPPSSAARSTCSATRCCWPRAGTRRGRRSACTWRRPPRGASTSSGSAASPGGRRARRPGLVIDFVHPATTHDETIVTLHSLLDRDVYRGGAIVVGPVRRGRGRRVRVERRIVPVSRTPRTPYPGARTGAVADRGREPRLSRAARLGGAGRGAGQPAELAPGAGDAAERPHQGAAAALPAHLRAAQPQLAAAAESAGRDRRPARRRRLRRRDRHRRHLEPRRQAGWDEVPAAGAVDKRIGRRDQAQAWVWRLASYTRELHEEYAVQRWPETKRLLGLLVNSSGRAHGRNARRLVHAARKQDRRLAVALLAGAVSHTPEGRGGAARGADADGTQTLRRPRASCCATSPKAASVGASAKKAKAGLRPRGRTARNRRGRASGERRRRPAIRPRRPA